MALTDAKAKNAKAAESGPRKLTDGGGLYLYISAAGAKSWRYDFRLLGKRGTYTIGKYPEITLADARTAHALARALVENEIDPGEHRKAETQKKIAAGKNTFEAVARDFIAKRLTKGDPDRRWTQGYAKKITRMLERDVFPKVGAMRITDVTAAELSPILESVAERKKVKMKYEGQEKPRVRTRSRGAAGTAVHIRQVCRAIFAHAGTRGIARYDFDPTWGLKDVVSKPAVVHNKHLQLHELPKFWNDLEAVTAAERVKIAIELLALTFVRTAELRMAERSEFELDGSNPHWVIPVEKMKKRREHVVPLAPRAVTLVRRLIKLASEEKSKWLFPNRFDPNRPMDPNTINQTLYRMGYAGKLSGHGFRGTASTALHESGFPPHVVEMQLAHWGQRDKTAASYNHALYWAERVRMMLAWSDLLYSENTNVIQFKKSTGVH